MHGCTQEEITSPLQQLYSSPARASRALAVLKAAPGDEDARRVRIAALMQLADWGAARDAIAAAPAALASSLAFEKVLAFGFVCTCMSLPQSGMLCARTHKCQCNQLPVHNVHTTGLLPVQARTD
jgi:hypothetical protein